MKRIQDIQRQLPRFKKTTPKVEEPVLLDKEAFAKRINELANRLNYQKEETSRRERFLHAMNRHNRFSK